MSYLCGCYYYLSPPQNRYENRPKQYIPLVDSEVHSTILSDTSRTLLKQTFTNPSTTNAITECIYTFPLYDGVSVVGFTCRIGEKILRGLVKEKTKAKETYDKAVARGETAGLLEQVPEASDVFSTKLGNIPAGQSVIVEIEYIGELKQQDDGTRFTIPTNIAPRYGSAPSLASSTLTPANTSGGIKITVDVSLPDGSFIKGVQSPSHPIAVSLGTLSGASNADPNMSKASATLSLGSTALEKDFVLVVHSKDTGMPKAILESHPTIPHHRALMATLVPKFSLPAVRPEIVFVADRSGSMQNNIPDLVSAMKVFLKSMPAGVKFNICSFGTTYEFLWPKSRSYGKDTLDEATRHLATFAANLGGTETFRAIEATINQRFTDIPLEIMLLTDGDIWHQTALFTYLNKQVELSDGNIRVFPLGIGSGVSHSLIEGLARAGNGFAQTIQIGERLDNAVVKMLRGALSPHITDYTLEVKYEQQDDDFELVDSVTDGMKVLLAPEDEQDAQPADKPAISLFDTSVDPEKDNIKDAKLSLPKIPTPKLLQAPHKIPSLFAFSRTTVYLLMSPETAQRNPIAVVLRATSPHGPLALEIPIEVLSTPGQTIHQLAAKKAVQDLEEGRGWIYDVKDQAGTLVKDKYPSCFDDLVKGEAVRLGERFQVAGKWCSFVAVSDNDKEIVEQETTHKSVVCEGKSISSTVFSGHSHRKSRMVAPVRAKNRVLSLASSKKKRVKTNVPEGERSRSDPNLSRSSVVTGLRFFSGNDSDDEDEEDCDEETGWDEDSQDDVPVRYPQSRFVRDIHDTDSEDENEEKQGSNANVTGLTDDSDEVMGFSLFDSGPPSVTRGWPSSASATMGPVSFDRIAPPQNQTHIPSVLTAPAPYPVIESSSGGLFGMSSSQGGAFYGAGPTSTPAPPTPIFSPYSKVIAGAVSNRYAMSGCEGSPMKGCSMNAYGTSPTVPRKNWTATSISEKVLALIELQDFEGFWSTVEKDGGSVLGFTISSEVPSELRGLDRNVWVTIVVIKFLEIACAMEEGTWGLVVEKARAWLQFCQTPLSGAEDLAEELVKVN